MSTISGINGSVKFGANAVAEVRNFKIARSVALLDANVMGGDGWMKSKTGLKEWGAEVEVYFDKDDAGQSGVEIGDTITVELFPEGDTTALIVFSGSAIVESHDLDQSHDSLVEGSIKLKGNGPLTRGVVT